MKRALAAVWVAAMLFAGCGGSDGGKDPGTGEPDNGSPADPGEAPDGVQDPGSGDVPTTVDPGTDTAAVDVAPQDPGTDLGLPGNCTLSPDDHSGITFTCAQACEKISTCPGEHGACLASCEVFRREGKVDTINDLGKCILDATCNAAPAGTTLEEWCLSQATSKAVGAGVSDARKADCTAFRTTAMNCSLLASAADTQALDESCLASAAILREEAWTRVAACKAESCDSLKTCLSQAACLDTVKIPDAPVTPEPTPEGIEPVEDVPNPGELPDTADVPDMGPMDVPVEDVPVVCKEYGPQTGFTFTCAELCSKSKTCEATLDTAVCETNCISGQGVLSVQALNDVATCVKGKECSAVNPDRDGKKRIIMGCFGQVLFPGITPQQQATCQSLTDQLTTACPDQTDQNFNQSCLQVLAGYRSEVVNTYLACKVSDGCTKFLACVNGAACFAGAPEP